jgi:cellulose synthase/poly-beta-1,6-N-acetylglucosamine synthase-like glycosyltransferase
MISWRSPTRTRHTHVTILCSGNWLVSNGQPDASKSNRSALGRVFEGVGERTIKSCSEFFRRRRFRSVAGLLLVLNGNAMAVFYFFAVIVIWLGFLSLRGGLSFAAYVRSETARLLPDFTPFVSIIAPCRGPEDGLRENIKTLFQQAYPAYEIIFVTDRADDLSLTTVEEVRKAEGDGGRISSRLVIAGNAIGSGQKVHNLMVAVAQADPRSAAFVFVDTDARPQANWLRSLVAPLADERVGAASGYRWFISEKGGLASQLRSVWNASIASALGEREEKNFCWGGSTAIRRSTFEKLRVVERWQGTISDDFTLTRVLQEAKLPIHFVPACLVASVGDCSAGELLEFSNRQLKITRVYAAHLWKPVLIGSLLFCSVFFGGLALVVTRAILRLPFALPLVALSVIYVLGAAKSYICLQAVAIPLAKYKRQLSRSLPGHLLLWPVASALYLCNAITAAFARRIKWRGITYELKSATEAVIISREP